MLDRAQVQKVAHLARLQLTPEEEEKFTTLPTCNIRYVLDDLFVALLYWQRE